MNSIHNKSYGAEVAKVINFFAVSKSGRQYGIHIVLEVKAAFLILLLLYKIVENMQIEDVIYLIEKENCMG